MTNLIQDGLEWMASQLSAFASDSVDYARGDSTLSELPAAIGESEHEDGGSDGTLLMVHSVDFIITAADLILNSAVITPKAGDTVTWESRTYEVRPFGPERQTWRFEDQHQVMIRIHTKQVS